MLKLKNLVFNGLLMLLYRKKVYFAPYVQTSVKLQLILKYNDKFIFVNNKLPFLNIDFSKKKSILQSVKYYLNNNVSKKINSNSFVDIYLLDQQREIIETVYEKRLFVDNLFIQADLSKLFPKSDIAGDVKLLSLEEVKLQQFKNKLSSYDYKVIVKSLQESGVRI